MRHRLGRVPLDSPTAARLAAPLLTAVRAVRDSTPFRNCSGCFRRPRRPGGAGRGRRPGDRDAGGAGRRLPRRHRAAARTAPHPARGHRGGRAVVGGRRRRSRTPVLLRELAQPDPLVRASAARRWPGWARRLRRAARAAPARRGRGRYGSAYRPRARCGGIAGDPDPSCPCSGTPGRRTRAPAPPSPAAWPRWARPPPRCTTCSSRNSPTPRRHTAQQGAYGHRDIPDDEELPWMLGVLAGL
ncbi:hypothetical protein LT493_21820 [Streptomyces tricolor]|nr:hypothetical protein [Streptomyces tricolor]